MDDVTIGLDELARDFTAHRSHLIGVGYRLTGTVSDAEDAIQEAWLRLSALDETDRDRILELRAWLTTVVARICLDRLRSAPVRREKYVGPWLPEPLVTTSGPDPLDDLVADEGVRMAAMVVLDRLGPEQRVAFVLHDSLGVPFPEIASILGCEPAAARQYASRARKLVNDAPPKLPAAEQRQLIADFVAALTSGDVLAVAKLLHPDVVALGDGGGKASAARVPLVGVEKVATFIHGLYTKFAKSQAEITPVVVNGEPGLFIRAERKVRDGVAVDSATSTFVVRDGLIIGIYNVVNPDKLTRLPRELGEREEPDYLVGSSEV
ncbi:sigma-70 family RNA polymerase sigma factor [Pseudonocardiaceae bacterium YIM PH 21723]|nr:sigma-70 family RNA polymerase sigma factor [Pseudonocardiaceae bacterium YIM PH 21723]